MWQDNFRLQATRGDLGDRRAQSINIAKTYLDKGYHIDILATEDSSKDWSMNKCPVIDDE